MRKYFIILENERNFKLDTNYSEEEFYFALGHALRDDSGKGYDLLKKRFEKGSRR